MQLLIYIKTTIRQLISTAVVLAVTVLVFPIIISLVMGFLKDSSGENPIEYNKANIMIINEDKSVSSEKLIDFIKSDKFHKLIKVTKDEDKADGKIIIPRGYEETLISNGSKKIIIKDIEVKKSLEILKLVIDNYHLGVKETNVDKIIINNKSNVSSVSGYELMAYAVLVYVIAMILYGSINSCYLEGSKNIDKRLMSLPIHKNILFFYDLICISIQNFIILFMYVIFFKILGIAFNNNFIVILLILIIFSLNISSIILFINKIFKEKIGKVIGGIVFFVSIMSSEIMEFNIEYINKFSITYYMSNIIKKYSMDGMSNRIIIYLLFLLLMAVVLIICILIIINMRKEVKD